MRPARRSRLAATVLIIALLSVLAPRAADAQTFAPVLTVTLEPRSAEVPVGTPVTLTATSSQDLANYTAIYLVIVDTTSDTIVKTCSTGTTCSTTVTSSTAQTRYYEARLGNATGREVLRRTSEIPVTWTGSSSGTDSGTDTGSGSYTITLTASDDEVASGSTVTLTARANQDISTTPYYMSIYSEDGALEASCGYGSSCTATVYYAISTTVSYYAVIDDYSGVDIQAMSDWVTVTWGSSAADYSVDLFASDTAPAVGEIVTLTAEASDDISASPYYITIYGPDGIEHSCGYGWSCTADVSSTTAGTTTYYAVIDDYSGFEIVASSADVTITWSGTGGGSGVSRIAGVDRFETSSLLSSAGFDPGVPVVYLATGTSFADALAGGAAAAAEGGPVLTTRRDSLPTSVSGELARLQPQRLVILGGTAAVSDAVGIAAASASGASVERVAGSDRYATAAAISERVFSPGVPAVFVATGANFADALSGGVAAAARGGPVLLVERDRIPESTAAELQRLGASNIYVLGSTNVVSDAVLSQLRSYASDGVTRYAGASRYDTAAAVSAAVFGDGVARLYLATGESFADALAGVALAGRSAAPMLLVRPSCVPASVAAEIARLAPVQTVIIGGTGSVGVSVESLTPC